MKDLLLAGVVIAIIWYVVKSTQAPTTTAPVSVPSVGPTDGGNTYPGMMGATYTPKPGSPGQLQPVTYSGFAPAPAYTQTYMGPVGPGGVPVSIS